MAKNHSQVLPGGTVAFPVPFGSPGLLLAGWNRPAGVSLLRCVCCPVQFMVTSWGCPRVVTAGKPRSMQETIDAYHLHCLITRQVHHQLPAGPGPLHGLSPSILPLIPTYRFPYSCICDMVFHMKTTLNIDDTVMAQLKREAARQKRTMS